MFLSSSYVTYASFSMCLTRQKDHCMMPYMWALLEIPTTIADNAGLDSAELIAQLRAEHHKENNNAGIDVITGSVSLYVLSSEPVKMPWFDSIYADIGDEQSLSQILWGIPGRSNAINITERLGLPDVVVGNARELHGTASAEINEVIEDMEKLKQKLHEHIHEARHHLKLARELHRNLVVSERRIREHATSQRYIKIQEISDGGGVARSLLHKKVRQHHASPVLVSKADDSPLQPKMASFSSQSTPKESNAALVSESNVKNRELGNPEIRFKTHPNINKDLFSNENILGSKDPNRPFPASESGDGLLKWRMQSKDASAVPLTSKFLYVLVSMLDDGLILLKSVWIGLIPLAELRHLYWMGQNVD
ncbi:DNA mismatch repair protein MutS [Tanacetum coccineum]|uniref:DNA mismatch repair protein MutS n=1 Tax=Tanacetum coccineum TaxID=301880 RepID=A0ABQ5IWR9_9ASTR